MALNSFIFIFIFLFGVALSSRNVLSVTPRRHGLRNQTSQKNSNLLGKDFMKALHVKTGCGHNLSGVNDGIVNNAFARKLDSLKHQTARGHLEKVKTQRIYIAACLHNSGSVISEWFAELTRLLLTLRAPEANQNQPDQKLFVSIYESGSSDQTKAALSQLPEHLNFLGVPHKITLGSDLRGSRNRIEFLASVRNHAMESLRTGNKVYDQVLWLSDNFFCADGLLQLLASQLPSSLGGLGADAVCGMDYALDLKKQCLFYDRWVSKDMQGDNFRGEVPYINDPDAWSSFEAGHPVQALSCWNAQVVFAADIFQQKKLQFRRNRPQLDECAEAETELIFHDMWSINRGKVAVLPNVAAAYDNATWAACALPKQPSAFQIGESITWAPQPNSRTCCPLGEHANGVAGFGDACPREYLIRITI